MTEFSKKKTRERAAALLRFAAQHGITCNAETVMVRLLAWDAQVAKARLNRLSSSSPAISGTPTETTSRQSSFEFGPRTTWRTV